MLLRFFFANNRPGFSVFFRVALFRLALVYPFCILISNSLTDVWDLLLITFWLLSFDWKEKYRIVTSSPILVVSVILVAISFIGVFQYEDSFFLSVKYWRGHHPIPILIILATTLASNAKRMLMLGSLALAFSTVLIYSFFVIHFGNIEPLQVLRQPHIAKNTIWFGMAFVLWAGLWICAPYSSRLSPFFRSFLPYSFRAAMRSVAGISTWDYFRNLTDHSLQVHLLETIRLVVLAFCFFNIFWLNPSRTAWLSLLLGVATILIVWEWRKGVLIALLMAATCGISAGLYSDSFKKRAQYTDFEITQFVKEIISGSDPMEDKSAQTRLPLYRCLVPDILRTPFGCGMINTREKCLLYSYDKIDNCHNEFISIALQSGWHGLACFLLWFFFLFRQSWRLGRPRKYKGTVAVETAATEGSGKPGPDFVMVREYPWKQLGLYVSTTLFVACMFNGALSQDMEGHLYCILIAILASADAENKRHSSHEKRRRPTNSRQVKP